MILVSACLTGEPVRYDGKSCPNTRLKQLLINKKAQALCPELLGVLLHLAYPQRL